MAFVVYGTSDGECGHVHTTIETAAQCLAVYISARKANRSTDRRVWRLGAQGREELTGPEHDRAYRIWSRKCW